MTSPKHAHLIKKVQLAGLAAMSAEVKLDGLRKLHEAAVLDDDSVEQLRLHDACQAQQEVMLDARARQARAMRELFNEPG